MEKARCLSLLADLAVDPRCARTLFRGGAVPQMLLNAQGCTHVELIDVYGSGRGSGGGGGGDSNSGNSGPGGGSDGRASPALSATSCESGTRSRTTTEDLDAEQEEEELDEAVPAVPAATGDPSEVACCRCRQAMLLLARLVRGLPGETPAVVVRHSGLRSIVQILEDGAAEAAKLAAPAGSGGSGLPAATEAAVREALEVRDERGSFVASKSGAWPLRRNERE